MKRNKYLISSIIITMVTWRGVVREEISRTVPGSSQAASQRCGATSSVTMATKIRSAFATLTETIFLSASVNHIEY